MQDFKKLSERSTSLCYAALMTALMCLASACGEDDDSKSSADPDAGQNVGADAATDIEVEFEPTPDDCITDVSAGDHTFTCSGLTFLVMVDEQCTKSACGLIIDVHGGTMSGSQMRDNTHLHELAPSKGYIVVHPSATPENTGGSWDTAPTGDSPKIADFMFRAIKAYSIDPKRVHVTGFSQGSAVTFYFLCTHPDVLASAAPISGSSANQACIDSIDADWKPRVPILFMNGIKDLALEVEPGRERVAALVSRLALSGGDEIAGDGHYSRKRWQGAEGMVLDFLEHDYGGQAVLDGHCIPGGTDVEGAENNSGYNATTCSEGEIDIHWGEIALQWFIDHPKP